MCLKTKLWVPNVWISDTVRKKCLKTELWVRKPNSFWVSEIHIISDFRGSLQRFKIGESQPWQILTKKYVLCKLTLNCIASSRIRLWLIGGKPFFWILHLFGQKKDIVDWFLNSLAIKTCNNDRFLKSLTYTFFSLSDFSKVWPKKNIVEWFFITLLMTSCE